MDAQYAKSPGFKAAVDREYHLMKEECDMRELEEGFGDGEGDEYEACFNDLCACGHGLSEHSDGGAECLLCDCDVFEE
jgi:hypothetical protein